MSPVRPADRGVGELTPTIAPLVRPIGDLHDGDVVAHALSGDLLDGRIQGFEPSLLPHLARLCHDFSVAEVVVAADLFGRQGATPPVWPQLWESAITRLASRFDDAVFDEQTGTMLGPDLLAVLRAVSGPALASERDDDQQPPPIPEVGDLLRRDLEPSLEARLLEVEPDRNRIQRLVDTLDPARLDAEAARALVAACTQSGVATDEGWVDRAVRGNEPWLELGRAAHVIIALGATTDRRRRADELAAAIQDQQPAPWLMALVVSRLGPLVSDAAVWRLDEYSWDEIWHDQLVHLLTLGPAPSLDADVRRSHPLAPLLEAIGGPHETTERAGDEMLMQWGGMAAAAAPPSDDMETAGPPDDQDMETAGPPDDEESEEADPPSDPNRRLPGGGVGAPPPAAAAPSAPSAPAPSAPAPSAPAADRRSLGVDVFIGGRQLHHGLVADVASTVSVSFGTGATAQVDRPASLAFTDADVRTLPVVFLDTSNGASGVVQRATMRIRKDPASSAEVTFDATPTGTRFSAMIALLHENGITVLQAATMTATVFTSDADEASGQPSIALSWVPVREWTDDVTAVPAVITDERVTVDTASLDTGSTAIGADVTGVLEQLRQVTTGFEATAGERLVLDAPDVLDATLIGAARVGHDIRLTLGLDAFDAEPRLQVIALSPRVILPLELVYEAKVAPDPDAEVCKKWKKNGTCTSCRRRRARTQRKVMCPSLFWGLSKVIEHHSAEASAPDFALRVQRVTDSPSIARPVVAVVAASDLVVDALTRPLGGAPPVAPEAVRSQMEAVIATSGGRGSWADDWDDWADQISSDAPSLLVAMPHQGELTVGTISSPALEIGGVFESNFDEHHVRAAGRQPGPLVLLIGCNTGVEHTMLASFASRFRRYAPVVVATVGEIIAQEAPLIVDAVIRGCNDQAVAGGTVGDAIRDARISLLADRRLAGLQLIVHGDGHWPLGP